MGKRRKIHWIFILILLLVSGVMEMVVSFGYETLRQQSLIFGSFLQICPVYNEAGSMFHAKSGIGYVNWMLFLEHILTLGMAVYLYRALELWGYFFQMSKRWLYALDFGVSATLYRVITRIRGTFTLDYLCVGRYTYDVPDLCIGVCVAGLIGWFFAYMVHYYPYKKKKVRGMNWKERILWNLRLSRKFMVVPVLPREQWQEKLLDQY